MCSSPATGGAPDPVRLVTVGVTIVAGMISRNMIAAIAAKHDRIVTREEGAVAGGAGSAVVEALQRMGHALPVLQLGLPDRFIEHGDPAKLLASVGLDAAGIEASVRERFLKPLSKVA